MKDQEFFSASSKRTFRRRRIGSLAALAILAGAACGLVSGGASAGTCAADDLAARLQPLAHGEVAAFSVNATPATLPPLTFTAADGSKATLDSFKGKAVLLNLWATWCIPCRREMPALDKLEAELGGKDFQVVAVSVDTSGPDKPKKWLADNDIHNLGFYADIDGNVLKTLQKSGQIVGLPTTILIDSQGCQRGIVRGPAEWAGKDAVALLRAALGRKE